MMRQGLTLIETVISVVVVSLLLAGALNAAGASGMTQALTQDRRIGIELCQSLMTEIVSKPYYDPDTGLNGLGPGFGEAKGVDRTGFDDVDDFNGWIARPPKERDGTIIPGTTGLTRSVVVSKYSNAGNADLFTAAGEVKLVTVKVFRSNRLIVELTGVRSPHWDTKEFLP